MKILIFCFLLYFVSIVGAALKARTTSFDLFHQLSKTNYTNDREKRDALITSTVRFRTREAAAAHCPNENHIYLVTNTVSCLGIPIAAINDNWRRYCEEVSYACVLPTIAPEKSEESESLRNY